MGISVQIYKLIITYNILVIFTQNIPSMHKIQRQITLILILLPTLGCNQRDGETRGSLNTDYTVSIKGFLEAGGGQAVVLEEMAAREYIPLDTVICTDSGDFEISIEPREVAFYVLRYGPSGYVTLLIEPGEDIDFSGHIDHIDSYTIEGSEGSELLNVLSREHRSALKALGEIARKNTELLSTSGYASMKPVIDRQFDSVTNDFHDYSVQFIHAHAGNLAILVALYNLYGQGLPVFNPENDLQVYEFVDSALMSKYNNVEAVALLNAQVNEAKRVPDDTGQGSKLKKGEIAPDFVSSRTDGSQLALSDFKGEYVLISFWAGWSRLSRDQNPFLRMAHERFGKYAFRILQVSLDESKEIWTRAIREDNLEWDHVSDLLRWDTPVADLYRIERIPSNVLVDPTGKIVETDLFDDNLLDNLELIFSK